MSSELGNPKSGWCFVAFLRFEQTVMAGRKVFFNRQELPSSTAEEIFSILKKHHGRIEFHGDGRPNEPPNHGTLDLTAEGKHFSGKLYTQKTRFSWQFKKSTLFLLSGDELDCKVRFHWISGKAALIEPLDGAPQARMQFCAFNEFLTWNAIQLLVLTGPRKQQYKDLARTVKVLAGPGDSREYRVKCLIPSKDTVKASLYNINLG